jgi:hypothetical protein
LGQTRESPLVPQQPKSRPQPSATGRLEVASDGKIVIASEAQQTISPRTKKEMDCFVAALLAMTVQAYVRVLAALFARGLHRPCPSLRTEGAGKTGCALHPRSRVQNCAKNRTRAYRFSGGIRPSLRNGFTAYSALSPATNSSCHRHRQIEGFVAPGWADVASADLTPATGARTTRFCRTQPVFAKRYAGECTPDEDFAKADLAPFVLRTGCLLTGQTRPAIALCADAAASTASHRAFRDDRDPPLFSGETGGEMPLICPISASGIFLSRGLDRLLVICPSCRSGHTQSTFGTQKL